MKRLMIIFSFLFFFLFNINAVNALSTASTGVYELYIRTLPNKNSLQVSKIPAATSITLINDTGKSGNGCDNNWFEIKYNIHTGYVCSTYLTGINWETNDEEPTIPDDTTDGEIGDSTESPEITIDIEKIYLEELQKFPDSYKTKLEQLHKIYPNAIFKAKNVDLDFNIFATYEYQGYSAGSLIGCGRELPKGVSLLEDLNRSRDGLKSLDSWAYNPLTDTFNTNFKGGEVNRWYAPSLNTVKYYLDPRNFLNEKNIFMFEQLTYSGDYYTEEHIEKLLVGTFMYKAKVTGKENTTFARAFLDASKQNNISPYFLVPRVVQEIGSVRTTMVSGTWTEFNNEYYGYYNFYNINASGSDRNDTIKNGLIYAKQMGWDNEYDAIVEGAIFLSNNYISAGQDTAYFQKFDIYGPCYGNHQFQQNIEAPYSESYKTYRGYSSTGMLSNNFIFLIPVYNNMPSSTGLDDSRNSNNYLRDLTVNGTTIEGFDYLKEEYTINVSPLIASIEIAATKASGKSSVTGTGPFKINDLTQTKEIVVTAENGSKKTYKITVTKDETIPISISEILNTMLVNSDGTYISSISLNTKASDFITRASEVDSKATTTVTNSSGEEKSDEVLATGDKVTITSGDESKSFTVVIYGDLNGDGIINSGDLLKMRQQLIGTIKLENEFKIAANLTKSDDIINSGDLLKMRQHLIGSSLIEQ